MVKYIIDQTLVLYTWSKVGFVKIYENVGFREVNKVYLHEKVLP